MKQIIIILFISLFLWTCHKDEPDYTQRTSYFKNIIENTNSDSVICVVTLIIQLGFTLFQDPWNKNETGGTKAHIDSLTSSLKSINPDIICLQEVPRNRYNTEIKDFLETLAGELNMNYTFGAHGYNDPTGIIPVHGEWGNAILTRYKILSIDNHENEYISIWERRSILSADIKIGNDTVVAYSIHFIPSDQAIANAVPYLIKRIVKKQIIMGDFNMSEIPELESEGYTDVFKSDTTKLLWSGIDRLFVSGKYFSYGEFGTITGNPGLSDHPANYCLLKLK